MNAEKLKVGDWVNWKGVPVKLTESDFFELTYNKNYFDSATPITEKHKPMTRTEQIEAAKAFTDKHKDSHRVFLEEGYIEASSRELFLKGMQQNDREVNNLDFGHRDFDEIFNKTRIWAIDQNGIATTDFI